MKRIALVVALVFAALLGPAALAAGATTCIDDPLGVATDNSFCGDLNTGPDQDSDTGIDGDDVSVDDDEPTEVDPGDEPDEPDEPGQNPGGGDTGSDTGSGTGSGSGGGSGAGNTGGGSNTGGNTGGGSGGGDNGTGGTSGDNAGGNTGGGTSGSDTGSDTAPVPVQPINNSTPNLPDTGSDTATYGYGLMGAGFILAGAALLLLRKRRVV